MEEGSLRCDDNVSINDYGKGLGTKTEVKNLNSSRFVKKALEYEIKRQTRVVKSGDKIIQETRLWDEGTSKTSSMRTKESSNDYRYFPEPDLPPYWPEEKYLEEIKSSLVELPRERRIRIMEDYKLNKQQASFIIAEKSMADFFEKTVSLKTNADKKSDGNKINIAFAGTVASWLGGNVKKILNDTGLSIDKSPLSSERFLDVLNMIESEKISAGIGKKVIGVIFEKNAEPEEIVKHLGMDQMSDKGELQGVISEIVDANPKIADAIRDGADKQIGFLMGQVMKATSGKANPGMARNLIREKIFNQG